MLANLGLWGLLYGWWVGAGAAQITGAGRVPAATFRKVGTHRKAGRNVATIESGKWVDRYGIECMRCTE